MSTQIKSFYPTTADLSAPLTALTSRPRYLKARKNTSEILTRDRPMFISFSPNIDEVAISDNVIEHEGRYYAQSIFPQWDKLKAPQKLTLTRDPKLREREIKDLCQILEAVSREYRARVSK